MWSDGFEALEEVLQLQLVWLPIFGRFLKQLLHQRKLPCFLLAQQPLGVFGHRFQALLLLLKSLHVRLNRWPDSVNNEFGAVGQNSPPLRARGFDRPRGTHTARPFFVHSPMHNPVTRRVGFFLRDLRV